MRNTININGYGQSFKYVLEYNQNLNTFTDGQDIKWARCSKDRKCIHLFEGDVEHFRHGNDWYSSEDLLYSTQYVPASVACSRIRVYVPMHSISTYKRGVKYAVDACTWINAHKVDLGSFIFKPTDVYACDSGVLKNGNDEYVEYIDFDIIDPYYLTYSDAWAPFRNNICKEPTGVNSTGSLLYITLYSVDEYDNRYLIDSEYVGGSISFNISEEIDYLTVSMEPSISPLGFKMGVNMNSEYSTLPSYLGETYGIPNPSYSDIKFDIAIKNKDSIIPLFSESPTSKISFYPDVARSLDNDTIVQYITADTLYDNTSFSTFFSSWDVFEEGWSFVSSLCIYNAGEEILSFVSNEVPITQEVFSKFVNGGSKKIIDITDDMITTYNVVNKIENKIVQLERPNESKSNIIQPVFFRVKETEVLTLHPIVTENICINLDDYKSKVDKFILQIEGNRFEQIGANKYGILFKVLANKIPAEVVTGTYYILNEDFELITTGKYNCVR